MKNKLIEQKAPFAHVLLLPVYILASILYLAWRIDTSYMWHTWYVYVFLSAEFYSILMTVLYLITSRRIMYPVWVPPLENKTVDVMIPTLNEPEHIVKMTAVGASYIKGVRHVFILDDGNRQNIREMAANRCEIFSSK